MVILWFHLKHMIFVPLRMKQISYLFIHFCPSYELFFLTCLRHIEQFFLVGLIGYLMINSLSFRFPTNQVGRGFKIWHYFKTKMFYLKPFQTQLFGGGLCLCSFVYFGTWSLGIPTLCCIGGKLSSVYSAIWNFVD